jgi:hypothetical protein
MVKEGEEMGLGGSLTHGDQGLHQGEEGGPGGREQKCPQLQVSAVVQEGHEADGGLAAGGGDLAASEGKERPAAAFAEMPQEGDDLVLDVGWQLRKESEEAGDDGGRARAPERAMGDGLSPGVAPLGLGLALEGKEKAGKLVGLVVASGRLSFGDDELGGVCELRGGGGVLEKLTQQGAPGGGNSGRGGSDKEVVDIERPGSVGREEVQLALVPRALGPAEIEFLGDLLDEKRDDIAVEVFLQAEGEEPLPEDGLEGAEALVVAHDAGEESAELVGTLSGDGARMVGDEGDGLLEGEVARHQGESVGVPRGTASRGAEDPGAQGRLELPQIGSEGTIPGAALLLRLDGGEFGGTLNEMGEAGREAVLRGNLHLVEGEVFGVAAEEFGRERDACAGAGWGRPDGGVGGQVSLERSEAELHEGLEWLAQGTCGLRKSIPPGRLRLAKKRGKIVAAEAEVGGITGGEGGGGAAGLEQLIGITGEHLEQGGELPGLEAGLEGERANKAESHLAVKAGDGWIGERQGVAVKLQSLLGGDESEGSPARQERAELAKSEIEGASGHGVSRAIESHLASGLGEALQAGDFRGPGGRLGVRRDDCRLGSRQLGFLRACSIPQFASIMPLNLGAGGD